MLILNKNILTIGGNRLEGGPLTPPEPPGPAVIRPNESPVEGSNACSMYYGPLMSQSGDVRIDL